MIRHINETHGSFGLRARGSWRRAGISLTIGFALVLFGAGSARSDSHAGPVASDREPAYRVSRVVLEYAEPHPDHPPLDAFESLALELSPGPHGLRAHLPGRPLVKVLLSELGQRDAQQLTPTAIREISRAVVSEFNRLGFVGVLVEPHSEDIEPRTNRDLRSATRTGLRLRIWTGRILRLRTFASGERIATEQRVDNPCHQRIKQRSPLQPVGAGPGNLMRIDLIEEYVARLNRHPGRRVDVALSPAREPGGVYLDYLVAENKPWAAYFQVNDTGTRSTGHARQRFGFMHTQLTGRDDVLQIDYLTGDFDEVHSGFASYEAPFFGSDLTRVQVSGSASKFDSEDFGVNLADFEGHSRSGGLKLMHNVFQRGRFLLDLTAGARWEHIRVDNQLALIKGRDDFFLPALGLRAERRSQTSNLLASLEVEGNLSHVAGTDADDPDEAGGLGRFDADDDWTLLRWDARYSTYLEPLLDRKAWEDLSTPRSSTLAHELAFRLSGQYAFDKRLVPQYEAVAGGLYTVRGYPQSVVAGDSMFLGSVEYRFHLPRMFGVEAPRDLPVVGEFRVAPEQPGGRPDWDLIFRIFADAARVLQSDRKRFEAHSTLVSVGGGIELQVRRNVTMRFDLGFPLDDLTEPAGFGLERDVVDRGDSEAHFAITTLF